MQTMKLKALLPRLSQFVLAAFAHRPERRHPNAPSPSNPGCGVIERHSYDFTVVVQ